ncbi:MAG: protein kinase domain-containing protein, partial [Brasilonema sp.]
NISPTMVFVIDKAIAYHPRHRFASAREMLQALQGIANTILPTQPPSTEPPVSTPSTERNYSHNGIVIGSAIAGGLIGASVIIGFVLTKSSQPSSQQPVARQTASSISSENLGSLPPSASEKTNPQPQKVSTPAQSNINSTNLPSSFYFLADSAFADSQTAAKQVKTLYSPQDFPTSLLSDLERRNVEYISEYQDRYSRRYFSK